MYYLYLHIVHNDVPYNHQEEHERRNKNMDEFLKIVGMNHIINSGTFENYQPEVIKLLDELKKIVSDEVFNHLEDLIDDAVNATNEYAFVEGMKTAIAITEKNYKPVL